MKLRFLVLTLLLLCVPAFAAVQVTSMDIYPRGAKVLFSVDAASNMTFQLPAAFDLESVRPAASAGVTVEYFQKAYITKGDAIPETLKPLYNTIKAKEDELAKIAARITAAKSHQEMIMNITKRDIAAANPSDYVKSLMTYYVDASTEINLLTTKQTELNSELNRLRDDYKRRLPANNERLIDIAMGVKGTGKVIIEAYTPYAGWAPSYKMNLNSKTGEVKSILVAQAYQKTGISYNGNVTFNTQNPPQGNLTIPKGTPMVVDFQPEYSPAPRASGVYMNQMVMAEADMAMPAEPAPAPMMTETLTNFSVKGKGNILGDGTAVSIDLGEQNYKGKLKVVLFRDYGRDGHLVVTLEKINELFMQGRAELSVDGQTSGQTQIANYGRGENVDIAFGYMPLIKVNKTTDVSKSGTTGWKSNGTIQEGYALEVINGASLAMDIELIDRLPYSANDKITVDNIVVEPAATTNESNVLTWKLNLKPGETKSFKVGYRVKHPSDKQVYFR